MGGVYDAGYRGEYNVNLINLGQEGYHISKGDKIAQLVIFPVEIAKLEEVMELSDQVGAKDVLAVRENNFMMQEKSKLDKRNAKN